jgi:hypothetical protein
VHQRIPKVPPVDPHVEFQGSMFTAVVCLMYFVAFTLAQIDGKMGSVTVLESPVATVL